MSELAISTGTWMVDSTKQQAFVDAWTDFVKWAATMPGATTFRLGHASHDERRFVSFAAWATPEEAAAWKNSPEFEEHIAHVLQYVDDFQSVQLGVVATVTREAEYGRA